MNWKPDEIEYIECSDCRELIECTNFKDRDEKYHYLCQGCLTKMLKQLTDNERMG